MSKKTFVIAIAAALVPMHSASAGGLFVPDVGTQALGRAGAFVAKADDLSALHHNPAGFASVQGTMVYLGANLVDFSLRYTRAGTYDDVPGHELPYEGQPYGTVENQSQPAVGFAGMQAIPLIVVASDLGGVVPHLSVAFGVMAPNAYPGRKFDDSGFDSVDTVAPGPQRYDIVEQDALTVLPSLAVAYSILGKIDVGARVSWGIADVSATSYSWGTFNYEESAGHDGRVVLSVKDNFVPAFGFGVRYKPMDSLELGLAYSSSLSIESKGTGKTTLGPDLVVGGNPIEIVPSDFPVCAPGGTPEALKACLSFDLPQTATLGGRWIFRNGAGDEVGDVELDVKWENWSAASDYTIIVDGKDTVLNATLNKNILRHGFKDVLSVRLGGSYGLDVGGNRVLLRGGVAHDTAAAPDSWSRVDMDGAARTTMAMGASYAAKRFRVDVGGGLVVEPDRTAPGDCNPTFAQPDCPPGSGNTPVDERDQPDPLQPSRGPGDQVQSPMNGGLYESGYLMFSVALSTWF